MGRSVEAMAQMRYTWRAIAAMGGHRRRCSGAGSIVTRATASDAARCIGRETGDRRRRCARLARMWTS